MTTIDFTTSHNDVSYYIEADISVYNDNLGVDRSDFVAFDLIDLRAFIDESMLPVNVDEVIGLSDVVRDGLNYHLGRLGII